MTRPPKKWCMQCEHMYLPDESILRSLVAREQLTFIANRLILNNAQVTPTRENKYHRMGLNGDV